MERNVYEVINNKEHRNAVKTVIDLLVNDYREHVNVWSLDDCLSMLVVIKAQLSVYDRITNRPAGSLPAETDSRSFFPELRDRGEDAITDYRAALRQARKSFLTEHESTEEDIIKWMRPSAGILAELFLITVDRELSRCDIVTGEVAKQEVNTPAPTRRGEGVPTNGDRVTANA